MCVNYISFIKNCFISYLKLTLTTQIAKHYFLIQNTNIYTCYNKVIIFLDINKLNALKLLIIPI